MSLTLFAYCQDDYVTSQLEKRAETDSIFSDSTSSILPKKEINAFEGLHYFVVDPSYRIMANFKVKIGKPFEMQTSTARLPVYHQYGVASFKIDGVRCKLNIYRQVKGLDNDSAANGYLFCPFNDMTNNVTSYGGGRYLDFKLIDVIGKKNIELDFNTCYNPYCAYNNRYSCPVPPKENKLKVKIEAGVKKWHE